MNTTLDSAVVAELGWTWQDHVGLLPIVDSNRLRFRLDLADGRGPNQADVVWHAEAQSLAAGQCDTLLLDALPQTLFGDTIFVGFGRIKAILLISRPTSLGTLVVGGAEADAWYAPFGSPQDAIRVMPGCPLLLANLREGWDVLPDAYALTLAAVAGPVTYDVAILGTAVGTASSSSGV